MAPGFRRGGGCDQKQTFYWRRICGGICGGIAVPLHGAQAVTITNGSFESGLNNIGDFTTINATDSSSITGWTVSSGSVDYIGTYWNAADGHRSLDMNGLSAGTISQMVTGLTNGQQYRVTFDLAGNTDAGPSTKTLDVMANAGPSSYSFSTVGHSRTNMGWVTESFVFTADGTSDLLSFSSTVFLGGTLENPAAFGPALDNVAISATPLPSTWLMLFSGFVGLGFFACHRKNKLSPVAA